MAVSATPKPAEAPAVAVAYSGGPDSTALLWATARAAQGTPLRVLALHVHHGLMPEAQAWAQQASQAVAQLKSQGLPVSFHQSNLAGQPAVGDSVEAWARQGRYAALARMAQAEGATLVLLAQHAEDQAETVLLQALRGAGPAGLAAMPAAWQADGLHWARPWLHQPRAALRALAEASGLPLVHDPSNADPRFARSRLREQVWPALVSAFPQASGVLAAVAAQAAQARALGLEVAAQDVPACTDPDGALDHTRWMALPPARRRNALAAWLDQQLPSGVPNALLHRLMDEWQRQGGVWQAPDGLLRSRKGRMVYEPSLPANGS